MLSQGPKEREITALYCRKSYYLFDVAVLLHYFIFPKCGIKLHIQLEQGKKMLGFTQIAHAITFLKVRSITCFE